MPSRTGSTIARHDDRGELRRHQRARRERAHPARVRPAVAVADALVILRGRRAARRARRRTGRKTTLPGPSDTPRSPVARRRRRTAGRPSRRERRASASPRFCGDDHALAGGEAVGLDDDGKPERPARQRPSSASSSAVADDEPGGRDAVPRHELPWRTPSSTRGRRPLRDGPDDRPARARETGRRIHARAGLPGRRRSGRRRSRSASARTSAGSDRSTGKHRAIGGDSRVAWGGNDLARHPDPGEAARPGRVRGRRYPGRGLSRGDSSQGLGLQAKRRIPVSKREVRAFERPGISRATLPCSGCGSRSGQRFSREGGVEPWQK